ncbi:MAG TPA: hypothetical protein GX497_16175 [Bacillus bacterium]|nr:hypothetical protein [Bacillus sp. (in: firmicutes)]
MKELLKQYKRYNVENFLIGKMNESLYSCQQLFIMDSRAYKTLGDLS